MYHLFYTLTAKYHRKLCFVTTIVFFFQVNIYVFCCFFGGTPIVHTVPK